MLTEESLRGLKPLRANVLIEWDLATDEYGKSGLIRPDTHKLMHYTGTVLSIGPWVEDVSVGMRVKFDRYCNPKTFYFDEKRYCIVKEWDIQAEVSAREVI